MKKWLGSMLSLVLLSALFIFPSAASAAPAPPLTGISVVGITSDGNDYIWSNPNLSGTTGYLAIYCEGTIWAPNYPIIQQGGSIIPTTQALANDYVTDSAGNVIGTIYYRAFDLNDVTNGSLAVSAQDYYTPHRTFTTFISITVS